MANEIFASAVALASGDGLDYLNGKYRFYLVDMDDAGPSTGAWKITGVSLVAEGAIGHHTVTITTQAAHGLAVGDRVAILEYPGGVSAWTANTIRPRDAYLRPTTPNGKRYRIVSGNQRFSDGSTLSPEPVWPTIDGRTVLSGGLLYVCDGPDTRSPLNGNWTVATVPSTTTFTIATFPGTVPTTPVGGYIANLSKTYLSEFVPEAGREAMSDPLESKAIMPNGALDCDDVYINVASPADPTEVLLLVKTAQLDGDPDLPDTAQRLIAHMDSVSLLPLPSNPGSVLLSVSSLPDRLLRL